MSYPPREAETSQERLHIPFSHAQLTANLAGKFAYLVPVGRTFVLDRVVYVNPTGLAADTANTFKLEVKNGATLMSLVFNTDSNDTPAGAALVANTPVEVSSDAEIPSRVAAAGESITLDFTEEGTATLPEGYGYLEGRLV